MAHTMTSIDIPAGLCSTSAIRDAADCACTPYALLCIDSRMNAEITPQAFDRMATIMADTHASIVYSDYSVQSAEGPKAAPCIDYSNGSLRDDFDFGPLVLIDTAMLKKAVAETDAEYRYAGWYDLRLRLSRMASITHIPESLYTATEADTRTTGQRQFDYVNPRNRDVQIEMEQACSAHLKAIGAYLEPTFAPTDSTGDFPVEASIIIPVRNRVDTIGDAVFSALDQITDFKYNVIVVDNHSTDGTTDVLKRLCDDPRLLHIIPESTGLGIGGCWNLALTHQQCGRFAVQLDSDDIYSSPDTLQTIVDCFHKEQCAMVIGTYKLTDFSLNTLPPGVIDHREWTDANGRNNALRINGLGAPRAYATTMARRMLMPDVSYGEDYAMGLRMSRHHRIGRIYDVLYLCRRWHGNSDASLSREKANRFNAYKDALRTWEIAARQNLNKSHDSTGH